MLFRWILSLFFLCVSGYLGYHGVYGQRGYNARRVLERKVSAAQKELAELQIQQTHLAQKVSLMQKNIDLDILEQLAWNMFRYISPGKKVILSR